MRSFIITASVFINIFNISDLAYCCDCIPSFNGVDTISSKKRPISLVFKDCEQYLDLRGHDGKAECAPGHEIKKNEISPLDTLVISSQSLQSIDLSLLRSDERPKREIDCITYEIYKRNSLVKQAKTLTMSMVDSPKKLREIEANDVKQFLIQLDLVLPDTATRSCFVEKSEQEGFYSAALYNVYFDFSNTEQSTGLIISKRKFAYVVKFHNPFKTTIHTCWNLHGVRNHSSLSSQNLRFTGLPKIAFDESIAKVALSGLTYNLSVVHAAHGELAYDIFKKFGEANCIGKITLLPKVKKTLSLIGESIGSFHCYHALRDPSLRKACIRSILGQNVEKAFNTITHNDLHPGNIFVDLDKESITLIDIETMFFSAVCFNSNLDELTFLCKKTALLMRVDKTSPFLTALKKSYLMGLNNILLKYFSM